MSHVEGDENKLTLEIACTLCNANEFVEFGFVVSFHLCICTLILHHLVWCISPKCSSNGSVDDENHYEAINLIRNLMKRRWRKQQKKSCISIWFIIECMMMTRLMIFRDVLSIYAQFNVFECTGKLLDILCFDSIESIETNGGRKSIIRLM